MFIDLQHLCMRTSASVDSDSLHCVTCGFMFAAVHACSVYYQLEFYLCNSMAKPHQCLLLIGWLNILDSKRYTESGWTAGCLNQHSWT